MKRNASQQNTEGKNGEIIKSYPHIIPTVTQALIGKKQKPGLCASLGGPAIITEKTALFGQPISLAEKTKLVATYPIPGEPVLTLRYSDEELNEFKSKIDTRLTKANELLTELKSLILDPECKDDKEQNTSLAARQTQFINDLNKALSRIENKTYGICRVTGKLIDKARLYAVPHATLSMAGKNAMENGKNNRREEVRSSSHRAEVVQRK